MRYTGDKYVHCGDRRCGKRVRAVRCPRCDGRVGPHTTCRRCGNTGYVCPNSTDDHHAKVG
ncbi:hypothetical protein [Streptomyces cellostaticus]|uniref:hypothetical protein n=1 Tax=Streptomyces TaxID=1883 RepID=UPI0020267C74|nr:hypothetical protein [Streptomyces cellostaticus]